jgi:phage-related protein
MAFDTFSPAYKPSAGPSSYDWQPRIRTAQFGDGYKQTAPDGLNADPMTVRLAWSALPMSAVTALRGFFASHVGLVFYYTLPDEALPRKWCAIGSSRDFQHGALGTFSVDLEERFDPDS